MSETSRGNIKSKKKQENGNELERVVRVEIVRSTFKSTLETWRIHTRDGRLNDRVAARLLRME